jgi:predicted secreted protein
VPQDWLVIRMTVQKEGTDAAQVQRQIKTSLASALTQAQSEAEATALEVSTGQMNVSPRYNREGRTNGWNGVAELILQGRDIERITSAAGRMTGLVVSQVEWQISPELLTQTQTKVQAQAVTQWRAKAAALTQQLGLSRYTIKELSLNPAGQGPIPGPRALPVAMMDTAADGRSAPLPLQAGQSQVSVVVSGQIWLQ